MGLVWIAVIGFSLLFGAVSISGVSSHQTGSDETL